MKVKLSNATIISVTHKKGKLRISLEAPGGDADATIADLNEMTSSEAFRAKVTIEGKVEQSALDWESGKPKPSKDGGA